jgi:hypothetical protein
MAAQERWAEARRAAGCSLGRMGALQSLEREGREGNQRREALLGNAVEHDFLPGADLESVAAVRGLDEKDIVPR